jgi:hypothetical protein
MLTRSRLFALVSLLVLSISAFAADKLKPERNHRQALDAIGTPAAREVLKGWQISGGVTTKVLVGGSGTLDGSIQFVSNGSKNSMVMKFGNTNYQGEEFTFDGDKVTVGHIRPGVRSKLGTFMDSQSQIVKEGLLGGVLSTAWPFFDGSVKNAKLSSDGLKKIDNRQLYQVGYSPKKGGGDITIKLYFEPETFRHVMTLYTLTNSVRLSSDQAENARQTETRIRLEEHFDDFKETNVLMLPTKWELKFSSEGALSGTAASDSLVVWDSTFANFQPNPPAAANIGQ